MIRDYYTKLEGVTLRIDKECFLTLCSHSCRYLLTCSGSQRRQATVKAQCFWDLAITINVKYCQMLQHEFVFTFLITGWARYGHNQQTQGSHNDFHWQRRRWRNREKWTSRLLHTCKRGQSAQMLREISWLTSDFNPFSWLIKTSKYTFIF